MSEMSLGNLGIKIESDFKDYYDDLSANDNYTGVYKRYKSKESRSTLMRWLKDRGINTIDLKAVREFDNTVNYLVVYTNPVLHNSLGKKVVEIEDARSMYANNLATQFHTTANGETIKFLQIGSRRFRIYMKNEEKFSLNEGSVVKVEELESKLNYRIMEPIFSIDYISNGNEMIAVDFNRVQSLQEINFQSILTSEEVVAEIRKALIAYNRL